MPLISLSRSDADYLADGRYWRGSLWLPTAYAALKGMAEYGYLDDARVASHKILDHMLRTYNEYDPHTIWECYSPEYPVPGRDPHNSEFSRPDFCGWSALGPISIFIEYIIGFYSVDAFEKTVKWNLPSIEKGRVGIKNLRFGDVVTDIIAENGVCHVRSNVPYTLIIGEKEYSVVGGEMDINL